VISLNHDRSLRNEILAEIATIVRSTGAGENAAVLVAYSIMQAKIWFAARRRRVSTRVSGFADLAFKGIITGAGETADVVAASSIMLARIWNALVN
jgi:hypothetical protein